MSLNLGVLSIQGDVLENILSLKSALDALDIDGTVTSVKTPDELSKIDGLIIPGGESTTIGQLSMVNGLLKILKEKIEQGMPVLGICAGMILLSKTVQDKVVGVGAQMTMMARVRPVCYGIGFPATAEGGQVYAHLEPIFIYRRVNAVEDGIIIL